MHDFVAISDIRFVNLSRVIEVKKDRDSQGKIILKLYCFDHCNPILVKSPDHVAKIWNRLVNNAY